MNCGFMPFCGRRRKPHDDDVTDKLSESLALHQQQEKIYEKKLEDYQRDIDKLTSDAASLKKEGKIMLAKTKLTERRAKTMASATTFKQLNESVLRRTRLELMSSVQMSNDAIQSYVDTMNTLADAKGIKNIEKLSEGVIDAGASEQEFSEHMSKIS